ncbi:MAG: hypothetical protein EOM59_10250 [Clostridia bacterium]|nr:hypothetical protein [Clostridia bacterium]
MEYYGMAREIVPQMLELLSCGEGFWLTVTGYSMTPTLIHLTDKVFISPFGGNAKKGDILLTSFKEDNCLLHRVVKRDGKMLYYRGDALNYCEGPIPVSSVIGIATRVKHNGRTYRISPFYNLQSGFFLRVWRLKNCVFRIIHSFAKK